MTSLPKTVGRAMSILLMAAAVVAAGATMPLPGTVNYLEGQVTLNGEPLPESAAGQAAVQTNQVLDTAQGMVELLLTPGVVLRVGSSSELRMVAPDAPNIAFELVKGGAILEVDQSFKGVTFSVLMDGATVNIAKPGLYFLGADQPGIGVLAGEAAVYQGSAHLTLKKGHGVFLLAGPRLKSQNLDMYAMENEPLYVWSNMRSAYLAQANIQAAQAILAGGGLYDAGWYWDAFFDCYAFLPISGIQYSPFGWGFSAPGVVAKVPYPIRYPIPIRRPKPTPQSAALSRAKIGRASSATMARSGGGSHSGNIGGGGGHMGGGGGHR